MLLSNKLLLKDTFTKYYYIVLVLLYSSILLFDLYLNFIPFFPDTLLYTGFIENSYNSFTKLPLELISFKYFSYIFSWVSINNSFLYLTFNLFINQIAIIIYWKAWMEYKSNTIKKSEQRVFLIISFFYPLSILYSLVPLRESYFVFAFSVFLYGFIQKKPSVILLIGLVLVFLFRREVFALSVLLVFLKYIFAKDNSINSKKFLLSVCILPVIVFIGDLISTKLLNISISPASLSSFRNYQQITYMDSGMTYPTVNWDTWLDLLIDLPGILVQFIYAPLPIIVHTDFYSSIAYLIDAIFMLILTLTLIIIWRRNDRNSLWWIVICIFLIVSSLFEYYLLGAIRHRYFITIMLFPIIAEGFVRKGRNYVS